MILSNRCEPLGCGMTWYKNTLMFPHCHTEQSQLQLYYKITQTCRRVFVKTEWHSDRGWSMCLTVKEFWPKCLSHKSKCPPGKWAASAREVKASATVADVCAPRMGHNFSWAPLIANTARKSRALELKFLRDLCKQDKNIKQGSLIK